MEALGAEKDAVLSTVNKEPVSEKEIKSESELISEDEGFVKHLLVSF